MNNETPASVEGKWPGQPNSSPEEYPVTPEEAEVSSQKERERVRPERRIIRRAGFTKNKGRGSGKAARRRAKVSRRMNRG